MVERSDALTLQRILDTLHRKANRRNVEGMQRFGMRGDKRLGISMPDLRALGKETGTNHPLAGKLWNTGIPEARILASLVADADVMTDVEAETWVRGLDSWDVCDQLCMNLLERTPFAWKKIRQWAARDEEFVRRAAFALLACMAWHLKDEPDARFTTYFPLIRKCATDERNYVKKGVSWALRNIGKRSPALRARALSEAGHIGALESPAARWIAADVMRDLSTAATPKKGKGRSVLERAS